MKVINALIILILPLVTTRLLAQGSFTPGYFVSNEDDTVRGFIDYRIEGSNYYFFLYKSKSTDRESKKYYAKDAKAFVIQDSQFYETHLATGKEGVTEPGFFKLLLQSKLSLLRFESRYFARSNSRELFEVSAKKVKIDPPQSVAASRNAFHGDFYRLDYTGLGILKVEMQDCPEISGILEDYYNRAYRNERHPDFISLFEKYNLCVRSPVFKIGKLKKSRVNIGIKDMSRQPVN